MLTPFCNDWRISPLPYSLSLATTVNTGGSYTTPSNAVRNTKYWAASGMQGYGPRLQYRGAGLDAIGCRCGYRGACACGSGLGQIDLASLFGGAGGGILLTAGVLLTYFLFFAEPAKKKRGERRLKRLKTRYEEDVAQVRARYGV